MKRGNRKSQGGVDETRGTKQELSTKGGSLSTK